MISIKKIYPDMIANGSFNLQMYTLNTVWPIFIFLILPEYGKIGFIQTVSLVFSLVAFHFAGKWTDRFPRKKVLLWGSVLNGITSFLRVFANSFSSIFILNSLSIFSGAFQVIPWNIKFQEHQEKEPRTEYIAIFELGGSFVAFLGLVIFAAAIQYVSLKDALFYGIIAGSISGLFVNLIRE